MTNEDLKNCPGWDGRYFVPTFPQYNNPHLYAAYAYEILHYEGSLDYIAFYKLCEVKPGLINRWPDGTGGLTSVDELIGASSLNTDAANRIYDYLYSSNGEYNNTGEKTGPFQIWLLRFPWLLPYFQRCSGFKTPWWPIGDLFWAIPCVISAFSNSSSEYLKWWLMSKKMTGSICGIAIFLRESILKFRKKTLRQAFIDELHWDIGEKNPTHL